MNQATYDGQHQPNSYKIDDPIVSAAVTIFSGHNSLCLKIVQQVTCSENCNIIFNRLTPAQKRVSLTKYTYRERSLHKNKMP